MGYKGKFTKKFVVTIILAILAILCVAVVAETSIMSKIYDTGLTYFSFSDISDILLSSVPLQLSEDISSLFSGTSTDYWPIVSLVVVIIPALAVLSCIVILILMIVRKRLYPIFDMIGVIIAAICLYAFFGIAYYCCHPSLANGIDISIDWNIRYYALAYMFFDEEVSMLEIEDTSVWYSLVYTVAIWVGAILGIMATFDCLCTLVYGISEANYLDPSSVNKRFTKKLEKDRKDKKKKVSPNQVIYYKDGYYYVGKEIVYPYTPAPTPVVAAPAPQATNVKQQAATKQQPQPQQVQIQYVPRQHGVTNNITTNGTSIVNSYEPNRTYVAPVVEIKDDQVE